MNATFRTLIYVFVFTGLLIVSCKKNSNSPSDFRDQYIGQYQVTERINCYGTCDTCSSAKDTVIVVSYGQSDATLNVLGREVVLDSKGNYYAYHYGLRLWNDSLSSHFMNGGLGCGKNEEYIGHRITTTP